MQPKKKKNFPPVLFFRYPHISRILIHTLLSTPFIPRYVLLHIFILLPRRFADFRFPRTAFPHASFNSTSPAKNFRNSFTHSQWIVLLLAHVFRFFIIPAYLAGLDGFVRKGRNADESERKRNGEAKIEKAARGCPAIPDSDAETASLFNSFTESTDMVRLPRTFIFRSDTPRSFYISFRGNPRKLRLTTISERL